jgi:hypothetical protein
MESDTSSERLRPILGVADIAQKYSCEPLPQKSLSQLLSALANFMECVRYINTRRSSGAILTLDSESAVQDAIYLMLRPWFDDLIPENPTGKVANRFLIKDFLIPSLNTVIEAKFIRDKSHGKMVAEEINDDIETYRYHPNCSNLVFFIYDPDALIPDRLKLEQHIGSVRTYGDKLLKCFSVVRP